MRNLKVTVIYLLGITFKNIKYVFFNFFLIINFNFSTKVGFKTEILFKILNQLCVSRIQLNWSSKFNYNLKSYISIYIVIYLIFILMLMILYRFVTHYNINISQRNSLNCRIRFITNFKFNV